MATNDDTTVTPQDDTNPIKPRATAGQKDIRVNEVVDLLLKLTPSQQICKLFEAKYGIKHQATRRYINMANKVLSQIDTVKPAQKRANAVKRLEYLAFRAMEEKQYSTTLKCLQEIHALYRLYEIELTEQDKQAISITLQALPPVVAPVKDSSTK